MRRWDSRVAVGFAVLACAFPALAIGGVHPWSIVSTAAFSTLFFAFVLWRRVALERRAFRLGWVGSAFLVATAFVALQLVPLPPALLALLSPKAHETLSFTLGAFDLYGADAWHPLSLDPPATALELTRLCGLTAAYLAARNAFSERKEAHRVLTGIVILGVVVVIIGIVQKVAGSPKILGLYPAPSTVARLFSSTFVNPNHLAGLLGLAACVALGLALSEEAGKNARVGFGLAAVLCGAGVALTLSRAGIAALGIGAFSLGLLLFRARTGRRRRVFWLLLLVLAAALAGALIASDRLLREVSPTDLWVRLGTDLKVQLWGDTLGVASDFARAGVGKGAFHAVFPLYQSNVAQYTYTHVENLPLQWVVDFGVVVGGGLLAVLVVKVGRLALRRLSASTCGAVAALWTLLLHNMADYNLEVSGVAYSAAVVLALALRRERTVTTATNGPVWRPRTWVAAASIAGFTAVLVVAPPYAVEHDKDRAVARVRAAPAEPSEVDRVAQREISRHGADYLVFLSAATRLSTPPSLDLKRAIRYANRALYLNSPSHQTHLVTARILLRLGRPAQAAIEYRLAALRQVDVLERVFSELAPLRSSLRWMREVAGDHEPFQQRLARYLYQHHRYDDAMGVLADRLRADADDAAALSLAARVETARGAPAAAESYAARLALLPDRAGEAAMLRGNALAKAGDLARALELYAAARRIAPRNAEAYLRAADLHLRLKSGKEARGVLTELERIDVKTASQARFALLMAQAYELEGNTRLALREYRHVLARDPTHPHARARVDALADIVEN